VAFVEEEAEMDELVLSQLLSQGMSVAAIGELFGRHPSTVRHWMAKYGLEAPLHERHRARGRIERSRLETLLATGMSIAEIATDVDRSKATVRHWLRAYGLETLQARRSAQRRAALDAAASSEPPARLTLDCRVHGETEFVREASGYYRCGRCRSQSVTRHRRHLKAVLIKEAGGECVLCGYSRLPRALEFHHLEPADKAFALSRRGITLSLETLRAEARKCVLLCSNCHAEVEDGVVALPDTVHEVSRSVQ
jgi:transposase